MSCASTMMMESHRSAATLYLTGELTTASVIDAIACIERLPTDVRALSLDLRGVRCSDLDALWGLEFVLRNWRLARLGITRVKLAPEMETKLLPRRLAHPPRSPASERLIEATAATRPVRLRISYRRS